jgi:hypothetical protein
VLRVDVAEGLKPLGIGPLVTVSPVP